LKKYVVKGVSSVITCLVVAVLSLSVYAFTPNDTYRSDQWALEKINAYHAWDIVRDCSSVTVGVIDDGIISG
jgi:hypothetical protein